jgi:hypothetical protein
MVPLIVLLDAVNPHVFVLNELNVYPVPAVAVQLTLVPLAIDPEGVQTNVPLPTTDV